jgi:hypothetical protein
VWRVFPRTKQVTIQVPGSARVSYQASSECETSGTAP